MRFDLLDEYGTVVPFGLGISKGNRVLQHRHHPEISDESDIDEAMKEPASLWSKIVMMLWRMAGRDERLVH